MIMKYQHGIVLSIIKHTQAPNIGGVNGDVQSNLATLAFKFGEQLENFIITILIFQQETNIYGELIILKDFSSITWRHFK